MSGTVGLFDLGLCKEKGFEWQPVPSVESLQPPSHRYGPRAAQIYNEIVDLCNDIKENWVQANVPADPAGRAAVRRDRDAEADLTARLLLHKAQLSLRDPQYADHILPDDVLCPPLDWPNRRPSDVVPLLRDLLAQLEIEDRLYEAKEQNSWSFYEQARISMATLNQEQRDAVAGYCMRKLSYKTESHTLDELKAVAPLEFRFFADIRRLCELLAQEPIEVSSGPQEERQQTTGDVIDEVKRQLTQLGTGEAFCALLQEDHTLATAKVKLLPAEPVPVGDREIIGQIRTRSWQRFSRSRAEIDEKTRARRAVGTRGTQKPPPPDQKPPPDTDPPIGRR